MWVFPYRKILLNSHLNIDSVRQNLNSFADLTGVKNNQWYNYTFGKITKKYVGSIYGNNFILQPRVSFYYNAPLLEIKGVFSEQNGKSNIEIKLTLPLGLKILLSLMVVFGFLFLSTDYAFKTLLGSLTIIEEYPYILFSPLVLYLIVMILFNAHSKIFIHRFSKHFEIDEN